jgi:hypothetical protein
MEKHKEKKEWTEPLVTEFDVAERTQSNPGDGPDGTSQEPELS